MTLNITKGNPAQFVKMKPLISIAICTHRYMNPFFVNSMFFMLNHLKDTKLDFEINSHMGVSNLTAGRQQRLDEAIASGATHLFFIDDDMVFSENLIHKMLHECNQLVQSGIPKVALGVNPCRKSPTSLFYTAKGINEENTPGMEAFLQSKGKSGVAEVCRCGLGAFLIETSILRDIPKPHFEILWDEEKKEHQGEDFYFIKKLRDHGVRIFVDQDISQTMGHAGEYVYSYSSYPNAPKDM